MPTDCPLEFGMCDAGRRLLAIASKRRRFNSLDELTDEELTRLTALEGIDAVAAVLYDLVRTSPNNQQFIQRVEAIEKPPRINGALPRVVVVPGAFYREYPHTGADGSRVMELARELGWAAERTPLPSFAPMAENAATLVDFLATLPRRPTILVSLSKGGADVRTAMERSDSGEALRDVIAWVNFSGMVTGTALVSWLKACRIRCAGVKLLLRLRRQRFATVAELERGAEFQLGKPFEIPPRIKAIHVAGFPLMRHLGDSWSRRGHARLAHIGPSDGGGVLLADVARLPGFVYPVWGADHYLRPAWDIRPLLRNILYEAAT